MIDFSTPIIGGSKEVSTNTKEVMNLTVNNQKSLCLTGLFKSLHLSLLRSHMFMYYLSTIIRIPNTTMH